MYVTEQCLCCGHDDDHLALRECWCVWEEIGVIVILVFLLRTSRKKQRLQPRAAWVEVSDASCVVVLLTSAHGCLCLSSIFHIFTWLVWRVPQAWWKVRLWLQSCSPIAVAGLWGAYCAYACLEALSVCTELGETEMERPELAGWVMNLLLRHSLKHNYTHQSQEGLSRPLTLS